MFADAHLSSKSVGYQISQPWIHPLSFESLKVDSFKGQLAGRTTVFICLFKAPAKQHLNWHLPPKLSIISTDRTARPNPRSNCAQIYVYALVPSHLVFFTDRRASEKITQVGVENQANNLDDLSCWSFIHRCHVLPVCVHLHCHKVCTT